MSIEPSYHLIRLLAPEAIRAPGMKVALFSSTDLDDITLKHISSKFIRINEKCYFFIPKFLLDHKCKFGYVFSLDIWAYRLLSGITII